jgi:hypothetical protein
MLKPSKPDDIATYSGGKTMTVPYPFGNPCKQLQVPLRFIKQSIFGIFLVLALMVTLVLPLIGVVSMTTADASHATAYTHVAHAVSQLAGVSPNDEDPWPHH